jgi:hypothetical protein
MVKITIKKSDMTEEPGSEGSADDSGSDEEARTPIQLIRNSIAERKTFSIQSIIKA